MAAAVPKSIEWIGDVDGFVRLIDQTELPNRLVYKDCKNVEEVWEAIKMLRVRGAPAIGITAAMGVVVGLRDVLDQSPAEFSATLTKVDAYLRTSRPTAVNLFWALDRVKKAVEPHLGKKPPRELAQLIRREALAIREEDASMCRAIGKHGAALIKPGEGVLTHCNTGGLATAEYGTALSILLTAADEGKKIHVFADETRPLLQGARLTMWELLQHGVPATLICDNMAAQVMKEGRIQRVFVGADRITANGDAANKIGTYGVAVLAKHHKIPFYVAAPSSTFDLSLATGAGIPIEQRDPREVTEGMGKRTAPEGVAVYNPAFDVTPAELIAGIVTEKGVIAPVTEAIVRRMVGTN
jgi:methylthioribose-1-phosphate isomerase